MLHVPDKPSVEESAPALPTSQPSTPNVKITYQRPGLRRRSHTTEWFAFVCVMVLVALLSYGVGAMMTLNRGDSSSSSSSSSSGGSDTMSMSDSSSNSADTANVPLATQKYGDQPATYKVDADGAKHFTLTAEQVMWEVTAGHRVLAWTINGTVPGPKISVNAGDHVRITLINHFPKATAVHWHGLEVSTHEDGVPGLGQKPIEPGQTYNFDFTLHDQDVGTHWYHSHYDDMEQETNGFYGAFIVNPRPGSPQQIKADVEYDQFVAAMGGYYVINGKSFPDTQPITVKHGQNVHIRLFGADSNSIHPMHLHGHSFQIVAEDGHTVTQPITKDTVQLAPGETYDLVFNAWATPGSVYPFHCHILSHLMNPGQTGAEMGGLLTLIEYAK
ncbi:hypothetical protein KDH_05030 [Dictyobacter sp. S3.2.2.5]|uniref:Multicopper oxidase n=1 Tax=Dictyobacter halimunensis TaxID=3026934 RepID=A0ABQ6FHU9_9CHLR|nr:hypothetical protein KDH_05030 [Dictyobacter sp. S3.2.2.5]